MQSEQELEPEPEYFPAGHGFVSVASSGQKYPDAQTAQLEAPSWLKVPLGQIKQPVRLLLEYRPGRQVSQVEFP